MSSKLELVKRWLSFNIEFRDMLYSIFTSLKLFADYLSINPIGLTYLTVFYSENNSLYQELVELRQKHEEQEQVVNKVIVVLDSKYVMLIMLLY